MLPDIKDIMYILISSICLCL